LLLEMIDVLDGLESALQHAPPNTDAQWLKGMQQAVDRFRSTLEKHDVKKITAVGKPFDPLHHEAIQIENTGGDLPAAGSQTVLEEFRSGYTMHGKVIRPARVKVSQ
jgi:molecular chaperone GrpE